MKWRLLGLEEHVGLSSEVVRCSMLPLAVLQCIDL